MTAEVMRCRRQNLGGDSATPLQVRDLVSLIALQPFRYAHPGNEQDHAHSEEQEEEKLRNSCCRRGNTGETKERRDQRDYQKYYRPTQHSNSPLLLAIRNWWEVCVHTSRSGNLSLPVSAANKPLRYNLASSRIKSGPR